MPPLHKNFQFCAEYLFLVLIYHGFFVVGFFVVVSFCFGFSLPPTKKGKKIKVKILSSESLFLRY